MDTRDGAPETVAGGVGSPAVTATVLVFDNHPAATRTLLCLRRQTVPPSQVVLVDNASAEPLADYLGRTGIELADHERVVRLDRNGGVGAGHNRAIAEAQASGADLVWLLEHDTFVGERALEVSIGVREAASEPMLAVVVALLGRNLYESVVMESPSTAPAGVGPAPRSRGRGHSITFNGLLLDLDLAEAAGPIREDLVVGLEDREFCKCLEAAGATILETSEVVGVHPNRGLNRYPEPQSPARCYYAVRNHLWVEREETGRAPLVSAARSGLGVARDIARGDRALATERIRGIADGLRPHP